MKTTYEMIRRAAALHHIAATAIYKVMDGKASDDLNEKAAVATANAAEADKNWEQPEDTGYETLYDAHLERAAHLDSRKQSRILKKYRAGYETTTAYSGKASLNNGDAVANALAGASPAQVMTAAEQLLEMKPGELHKKYGKLNPGQQRMNAGNRIRNGVKKEKFSAEQVVKAINIAVDQDLEAQEA